MKRKIQSVINHPLFSGSAIMIGGSMVANAINYLYHVIMGRILSPAEFGVLSSLYALLYMVSIIPTSTSLAIVKFIASAKTTKEQSIIYHNVAALIFKIATGGTIILIILSPFIRQFLNIDSTLDVALIAPVFFFSLLILVNQATAQGLLDFLTAVIPLIAMSLGKIILGVLLVMLGFSVGGAMVGVVVAMVLGYIFSKRAAGKFVHYKNKSKYDFKPLFKYSAPVLLQAMAFTSLISMDVILVKHFFEPEMAGYYAALSTLGKIIYFASSPVTSAMFPVISKRVAGGQAYIKVFVASLGITLSIALGITAGYLILPNLALGLTFGANKFISGTNDLVWMGLFFSFYAVSYLLVGFFLSINKTKVVILPIIASILQIVIIWFWHTSLLSVIQISLSINILLTLSLSIYFGYYLSKLR